jgi:hypothetical protein
LSKQPPEKRPSRQDVIKIPSRLLPLIDTRTLFWSNLENQTMHKNGLPKEPVFVSNDLPVCQSLHDQRQISGY